MFFTLLGPCMQVRCFMWSSPLWHRWYWPHVVFIWLSPYSKGLALPAVQPLSYMVRGKQGLFMDFLALKLTWDASY